MGQRRLNVLIRHQFVLDAPAKHPPDALDVLVDHSAGHVRLNDGLTHGLQLQRAEFVGPSAAVETAYEPEGGPDAGLFVGGPAALDVVGLGVGPVGQDQLIDRDPPRGGAGYCGLRGWASRGKPLGDATAVLLFALGRSVNAEVDALAINLDQGLTGMALPLGIKGLTKSAFSASTVGSTLRVCECPCFRTVGKAQRKLAMIAIRRNSFRIKRQCHSVQSPGGVIGPFDGPTGLPGRQKWRGPRPYSQRALPQ